ncbi:MAG: ABC transporter permease, partial [Candidatus Binataceae bacterium]
TESVDSVIASIDRQFANSAGETQSESESSFVEAFANVRSIFNVINALAVIVVFTIALVAANTAVMAIRERRGEIAVMRAIGFGPFLILAIVLGESILVGILGGLVGCLAAYAVQVAIPAATLAIGPVDLLSIPARVVAQGFAVAIAIGVVAGIVPAVTSMRADIVDSLRAVG